MPDLSESVRDLPFQLLNISTTAMPMTTKLGREVTYHKKLLTMKSQDP